MVSLAVDVEITFFLIFDFLIFVKKHRYLQVERVCDLSRLYGVEVEVFWRIR